MYYVLKFSIKFKSLDLHHQQTICLFSSATCCKMKAIHQFYFHFSSWSLHFASCPKISTFDPKAPATVPQFIWLQGPWKTIQSSKVQLHLATISTCWSGTVYPTISNSWMHEKPGLEIRHILRKSLRTLKRTFPKERVEI